MVINAEVDKVAELKSVLEERWHFTPTHVRLFYKGVPLQDDRRLSSYPGINEGSRIHVQYSQDRLDTQSPDSYYFAAGRDGRTPARNAG